MKFPDKYIIETGIDGGMYSIPFEGRDLNVIASNGANWDHVSVSLKNRCPNWREMCFIKDLFFEENEVAMQLHPAKDDYINMHPYCLHLWRAHNVEIPMPPSILVGFKWCQNKNPDAL